MSADLQSPWTDPRMVAGFSRSGPNPSLMQLASAERRRHPERRRALDLGCGAGRNAVPLAASGWHVFGIDFSAPMLDAARARAASMPAAGSLTLARAAMDRLPSKSRAFDFAVAHGIWNLARSSAEFRLAVREAARVLVPGAAVFVFTFSRTTLPAHAEPLPGEPFVFTQFAGEPQCFLTEPQLLEELAAAGFTRDSDEPFRELNRRAAGELSASRVPVIYEGVFRLKA